jgi:hypothetical protein
MVEESKVDKLLAKHDVSTIKLYDSNGKLIKTLSEDEIKMYSQELVEYLIDKARTYKDVGMMNAVLKQLIEIKKAYWPATQTSKNLNVNVFDDQLSKWYQATKELQIREKDKILITTTGATIEEDPNGGR